jgi:predicted ArsR family transcriptional regulator
MRQAGDMTSPDRTTEADDHATAIIAAMLTAEDTGDPSQLHAALEAAAKAVPASVAVTALASLAATAVRLLATGQDVPWQQVVERLGMASRVMRGGGPGAGGDTPS